MKSAARKLSNVESKLSTQFDLEKREELLETKVMLTRGMNALEAKKVGIADDLIQIDTDIIQSAFDEQDDVVSVRKTDVGFRIFQQVWNEKIMNSYEKDKLQYLTSQEKERYFKDKLRELEKFDVHGVLRKPDWFFRVVVLDYIVGEMKRLVLWFKDCSWDDFETVYKITRKLRMLQLDVDAALSDKAFDINHTNLFQVTDEDAKDYTKIDKMLVGNTLYELFSSIVKVNVKLDAIESESPDTEEKEEEDKEVVMDRKSEIDTQMQRNVRQDVVTRYWGSESALTKQAYDIVNQDVTTKLENPIQIQIEDVSPMYTILVDSIAQLKNQITRRQLPGGVGGSPQAQGRAFRGRGQGVENPSWLVGESGCNCQGSPRNREDERDEGTCRIRGSEEGRFSNGRRGQLISTTSPGNISSSNSSFTAKFMGIAAGLL